MTNSNYQEIKSTDNPIKKCIEIGNNCVIIIDKSIVQKIGITKDTFLEQEVTKDGIVMRLVTINEIGDK